MSKAMMGSATDTILHRVTCACMIVKPQASRAAEQQCTIGTVTEGAVAVVVGRRSAHCWRRRVCHYNGALTVRAMPRLAPRCRSAQATPSASAQQMPRRQER
jgi:hypothetical protein